jgi:hypothetical protein
MKLWFWMLCMCVCCILASSRITWFGSWKMDPSFLRWFYHTGVWHKKETVRGVQPSTRGHMMWWWRRWETGACMMRAWRRRATGGATLPLETREAWGVRYAENWWCVGNCFGLAREHGNISKLIRIFCKETWIDSIKDAFFMQKNPNKK